MGWLKAIGGIMSALVKLATGAAIYLAGSRGVRAKAAEHGLERAKERNRIDDENRRLSDADALDKLFGDRE